MGNNNCNLKMDNRNNKNDNDRNLSRKKFINPYDFVPLSEYVYKLDSNEKTMLEYVHDIPFKDGISGEIEVKFESVTPFCISAGIKKNDQIDNCNRENVKINDKYYIPATSIKGMIANVLKIISYGNMANYTQDNYYLKDGTILNNDDQWQTGFLFRFNNKMRIIKCESYVLSSENIKDELEINDLQNKSIRQRYDEIEDHIVDFDKTNSAMIVFSGNMSNRDYEYYFEIPTMFEPDFIDVDEGCYKEFLKFYRNTKEWSCFVSGEDLYNYCEVDDFDKKNFEDVIPCFFLYNENKIKTIILHKKSVYNCFPKSHEKGEIDLCQSIFGFTDIGEHTLKGRVMFSNTLIDGCVKGDQKTYILESPHPEFYHFYVDQGKNRNVKTYFSENSIINGWKRFVIQNTIQSNGENKTDSTIDDESKVKSNIIAIPAKVHFNTLIRFHNLRPFELGALISAITFCGNEKSCYHSIGIGKAFGYGKIKVDNIKLKEDRNNKPYQYYLNIFDKFLLEKLPGIDKNKDLNRLFIIASGKYLNQREVRYKKSNESRKKLMDYSIDNSIKFKVDDNAR